MAYKTLQLRKDTAANWTSNNPTLLSAEMSFETDTKKVKIGDGTTAWNDLDYFAGNGGGADVKVAVDIDATAGYLGAANNDGVLRTGTSLSYADGGNFITLNTIQDIRTTASPIFDNLTISTQLDTPAVVGPSGATELWAGWGPIGQGGADIEFYEKDHASRAASIYFTFGKLNAGEIQFNFYNSTTWTNRFRIDATGGIHMPSIKKGITQVAAGAAANELWADTDDSYTIKLGI